MTNTAIHPAAQILVKKLDRDDLLREVAALTNFLLPPDETQAPHDGASGNSWMV